jgi:mono/diheme cytochrome c family protein
MLARTVASSLTLCIAAVACIACDSLDPPIPAAKVERLVIPTDIRPAFRAQKIPPPVSGGTLLVTRSGAFAVAADPERDAVVVADLATWTLVGRIALEPGDEPGRVLEDGAGRVHVALRRGGAVVTVDPGALRVLERRPVCGAPRGMALAGADSLVVACGDGKLVTLPVAGGEATSVVSLDPDLRDVIVTPEGLTVSRFKTAELLRLDAGGGVTRRDSLPAVMGTHRVPDASVPSDAVFGATLTTVSSPFRPLVAWRSLAGPNGSTVIVHQRALDADIDIVPPSMNGSAYGGSGVSCDGISQDAVTIVAKDGTTTSMTFHAPPLPVDATLLPDGMTLLVAHAGPSDPKTPRPFVVSDSAEAVGLSSGAAPSNLGGGAPFGAMTTLSLVTLPPAGSGPDGAPGTVVSDPGCNVPEEMPVTDQAVAVAYNPAQPNQIVVQTTQPSSFVLVDLVSRQQRGTLSFDDGTTLDTGFQLFHRDSGAGIACATCHAEGAEDGNVWRFSTVGARRTQALHVGLEGTAPFHWDGQLLTVGALMGEVFVGRMGGVRESDVRLESLANWLFALKAPAPLRAADDAAVVRGKALFRSSGCAACHAGDHFTNNASVAVGTSENLALQVPSLVGVGYRAPFLHDGCAKTLADRFNPACGGGDLHGDTSRLDTAQIADLSAYLESL